MKISNFFRNKYSNEKIKFVIGDIRDRDVLKDVLKIKT